MILTIYDIVLLVALALLSARVFGYIFDKIKQPIVIGEIITGIILGFIGSFVFSGNNFSFINLNFTISDLNYTSYEFEILAMIGILFLLFISGLETSLSKLKKTGKIASLSAIGGVTLPFILGTTVGLFFGFPTQDSIVIGLILTATSVGVTVRTLLDLRVLDSDVGATILGGAVIDDVIGIMLLAFFLGTDSFLFMGFKIIIFFLIFLYLGLKVIDKILHLGEKIHLPKAFLSFSLAIFLLISFFADKFGIAGIVGAFVAGILIGHTIKSRRIMDDIKTIGYGFFIPLFFVWIGARLSEGIIRDVTSFFDIILIALLIIFIGIIGKIFGCGIGAKVAGMKTKQAFQVGVGMIPRMEVALIIVSTAISHHFLSSNKVEHQLLAISVLLTIITTLVTPFLIKYAFKKE